MSAGLVAVGCSSDDPAPGTPAEPGAGSGTVARPIAAAALPQVGLIGEAVQAVEARLGGAQQYFEINATPKLVNVIVAVNNATLAQNWLYLDGVLSSVEPQSAAGKTFAAAALTFDPATVLGQVATELSGSSLDLFVIEGGPNGVVRYTVAVTSSQGGQLLVVVGPDGKVIEVDPS